jgi:hypothetical protein
MAMKCYKHENIELADCRQGKISSFRDKLSPTRQPSVEFANSSLSQVHVESAGYLHQSHSPLSILSHLPLLLYFYFKLNLVYILHLHRPYVSCSLQAFSGQKVSHFFFFFFVTSTKTRSILFLRP